ncbi:RusA-like resolvase [Microbacterium phage Fireman]|uniref:RusA-like resolvase n=4 Tax=Metamorphoovirus TaxID=2733195 RepID=A0A481VVX6_9CAUD|nr:RusA-like Holliday junction resolvase [Microbacterium phage Metamorphoo]YP_009802913.1 RusA-like Holliday junction resolvase [Microbacterium phage RobsFeet]YP_009820284.1 RusA-like Holliday junction resolvase [Microbacterium phage Fireman]YP_010751792.1 RusA-like resolvase [Microbacterium phage Tyrumbra]AWY05400.1 resolvase [Microbacterium phage Metamorphoo]AWY06057.1 RusA-like resolvase [Microbacterium phage RobsFeet]QBI98132.1 RusA-like resolvase [Microbacterium phage Fireman]QDP43584.1
MTEHRLVLNYERPPLSENYRQNRYERARLVRDLRTAAGWWARSLRIRAERVEVGLIWVVADGRRRDEDNVVPTLKALCDGLVDGGIVPDDTPQYMVKRMPVIERRDGETPHLELVLSVPDANLA